MRHAVHVGLRHDRVLEVGILKAPRQAQRRDQRTAAFQPLRRLILKLDRALELLQRLLQALAARHPARQHRHPPALLLPLGHLPGKFLHVALKRRTRQA